MKQFSMNLDIYKFDSFRDFAKEFEIGPGDLIFTNKFLYDPFMKDLDLKCDVYFQEKYGISEPTDVMINAILKDIDPDKYQRVIAVGGGSVVDIGKLLCIERPNDIRDIYENGQKPVKKLKLVIVPTTCGTGSEVTNIAMCYLTEKKTKVGCANDQLFADHAVLIPELVKGLPFKFFIYSSIDALIHAVESFVGRRATSYSRMFSTEAIKLLLGGFKQLVEKGPEYRLEILDDFVVGSDYAGIAFQNGGCNAIHAMSFPLGGMFKVPHGESNYEFFTTVMKYYYDQKPDGDIQLLNKVLAEVLGCSPEGKEVYDKLEETLAALIKVKPLTEYGVTEEICRKMAEICYAKQQRLLTNTYVEMDTEEIYKLYMKVYNWDK